MMYQERLNITKQIVAEAGRIPMGFHVNAFAPTEVCLGSDLLPGKTFLEDSQLLGQCSKCLNVFVFNVYIMEWIKQAKRE